MYYFKYSVKYFFKYSLRKFVKFIFFTVIFTSFLCFTAFASQYEYKNISDIAELEFYGGSPDTTIRVYCSGNYDPNSVVLYGLRSRTGTTDGQEYFTVDDYSAGEYINCLRIRYNLIDKLQKSVTPEDTLIYNGYFYLLSNDSNASNQEAYETLDGLKNNLKNMYFNVYGVRDNVLVSYRVPLASYIKESGFQRFPTHSHTYFNISLKYSFTENFTITGFSFDFNGCQPFNTVTVTAYPTADWSSGSAVNKPIQLYIGSSAGAPSYVVPDDSVIKDYNQAEDELLNSFDSNSALNDFSSNLPDTILGFANGLGAVTTLFNEFLLSFPYITPILQISLAFGIFAFIFSVAQSVFARMSRDRSSRAKR